MADTVSPTARRNTHHLKLSDGVNSLSLLLSDRQGRTSPTGWQRANSPKTSLRVVSGNEGYGDFELPFSSIVQADWSGGRGARDFEKDTTRYSDGYRCDTTRPNEFRCGPLAVQGSGYNTVYTTPVATAYEDLCSRYTLPYAGSFTPNVSMTIRSIDIPMQITPTNPTYGTIMVQLCADSGGNPGSVLAWNKIIVSGAEPERTLHSFPVSYAVTSGTKYHVVIYGWLTDIGGQSGAATIGTVASVGNTIKRNQEVGGWTTYAADKTFYFQIQTQGYGRSILFDYRGRQLAVTQSDDQTAPKLWMQGYHGMGADNAADKSKLNTTIHGITANALVGKYARIVSGPGSTEETPWRKIVGNADDGSSHCIITVAPAWNITHTTSTEFVIQGCTNWQQITDTETGTSMAIKNLADVLTAPVTDVLVVDDILYFCQGEAVNMVRTRFNAGVWSDMVADGTNKYTWMELVQDDKGVKRVWGAARAAATIAEASKVAWGTNLTFSTTALVCGDTSSQITGLLAAKIGGPMLPVVFKETEFGSVSGTGAEKIYDTYYIYPEARDDFNGRAAIQPDVYLWFSLMDGVERFYDQRLDDVGPNRDDGMPKTRKGRVSAMVKYFSQIYAAYDAGRYGYSSILRWNGAGWCEVYRGGYGRRIRALHVDVLPDLDNADRLWFSEEEDIYYIPLALDPDKTDGYTYFSGAQIVTSKIYGPYRDITKYWDTVALFGRNLSATKYASVEYRVDSEDNAWVALPTTFTTSPVQENNIATLRNVTGKWIQFRVTLTTNDTAISPIITAMRVNAVVRVKPKAVWNVTCKASDESLANLQDELQKVSVKTIVERLEGWQDGTATPAPLTASFVHALQDQKRGFVDSVSTAPIEMVDAKSGFTMTATLISFQFIEV